MKNIKHYKTAILPSIISHIGYLGLMLISLFLLYPISNADALTYKLSVDEVMLENDNFKRQGIGYNGTSPGPILYFQEGEEVTIEVTNNLKESTSIHWHGLAVPFDQDGTPEISFAGIKPNETFTYRFKIKQAGTYWYHSHTELQQSDGAYGAIIITPKQKDEFSYDRDYVVQLNDSHPESAMNLLMNLQGNGGHHQAASDMTDHSGGMMQMDIEDITGYTTLINGKDSKANWTGLFNAGETLRLRLINSSSMTYYDIHIPGLKMTVVAADGNNIQPVEVDSIRIAVAETYDVLVTPKDQKAYTIFAQSMARSGYGRATIATEIGLEAAIPSYSPAPSFSMSDMMGAMPDMDHSQMGDMSAPMLSDPFYAHGSGLIPQPSFEGEKYLSYADLQAVKPLYPNRPSTREIEIRLTGSMMNYIWSINGKPYSEADVIELTYGERVRFKFVNETEMIHPMHLHGMWMILDNGSGEYNPAKHTISIAPATTVYAETEVDATGDWLFHCHLDYHMMAGMMRKIVVIGGPKI